MIGFEGEGSRYDREVAELWCGHYTRVRGYLINLGASVELAEEVAADAFMAARVAWSTVREYESPKAFVFKVAGIELGRRWLREREWRGQLVPEPPEAPYGGSDVDLLGLEAVVKADVQAALKRLPRRYRQVILLRHYGDFSIAETAQVLGLSEGTVKGYASDGRARLAGILADYGEDGRAGG